MILSQQIPDSGFGVLFAVPFMKPVSVKVLMIKALMIKALMIKKLGWV